MSSLRTTTCDALIVASGLTVHIVRPFEADPALTFDDLESPALVFTRVHRVGAGAIVGQTETVETPDWI